VSDSDSELVRSVHAVRECGTSVAFGFHEVTWAEPVMPRQLAGGAHAGLTYAGAKLEQPLYGTVALLRDGRRDASLPRCKFVTRRTRGNRYAFHFCGR